MKIRQDFVTNSSSSSFIIAKKYLDEDQILGKMSEILDNSIFEMKAKKCFNNKITC